MNDAEGHGLTPLFREMIAMRNRHHQELDGMLRGVGEAPDESGSFMSTAHRTIIKVRSLFGGLGESILPGLIDGEKRILGYYDELLKETAELLDRRIVTAQRADVERKIAKMEAMKTNG